MKLELSLHALWIVHQLHTAGYEVYLVGGAVRDLVGPALVPTFHPKPLHPALFDYDFATNATPEQIQAVFPESFYENQFGTVSVTFDHINEQLGNILSPTQLQELQPTLDPRPTIIDLAQASKLHPSLKAAANQASQAPLFTPSFQITTYRADELYDNHRQPTSLSWGKTLAEDLDRRDFTINALALICHVPPELFNASSRQLMPSVEVELIDRHGGILDLQNGVLQTVGDPHIRFQEDALRMLRAIRFSVQLNYEIAEATFAAIQTHAGLLAHISAERIRDEFLKMLASPYPAEAVELLDETGLLQFVIPELLAAKGVEQAGHHTTDVWTHSLDALRYCPSPDPIVRLATLIHDIAKPDTQRKTDRTITFYNHEIIGARTAKRIGQRLHLARKDIDRLFILVRFHMFYYQPENTDAAIRRLMRQVGLTHLDDLLDVREGDRLGSGARQTSWRLEELKQRMIEQLHQPMDVTDLAINGHDLMTELGLHPSPILGELLQALLELVLEKPDQNHKATLLDAARQWLSGQRDLIGALPSSATPTATEPL